MSVMPEKAQLTSMSAPGVPNSDGPIRRPGMGAILAWLLFSFVTLAIGFIALPGAARDYDFRAFYAAGYLALHHPAQLFDLSAQRLAQYALIGQINPGLAYYHPAFEVLLYAPLALFTYRTAYISYAALNLVLLGACYFVAPIPTDPFTRKFPRSLLFFAFPAFYCIATGQDSMFFLLLLCFLWRSLDRGDDITAGVLLALGLFKFQLVVALVIFLVARRGTRLLRSFVPTAAALALLSLAITGFKGAAQWIHLLFFAAGTHQVVIGADLKAMPTLGGLIDFLGGRFLPRDVLWIIELIFFLATFVVTLMLVRRSNRLSDAFSVAIAGTLVISPHLYLYDYVLLIPALLLLTGRPQRPLIAIYCVLPLILFAMHALDWLVPMAILPIAILVTRLTAELSIHRETQREKVTPHPLTALD